QDAWEPVAEERAADASGDEDAAASGAVVGGPTLFDQDAGEPTEADELDAAAFAELDDPGLQPQADLAHQSPAGATVAAAPRVHLRYEPALDGLRGLAVLGVLFFHGQFAWAKGGFLGVSTFFTLSGFLITTLLVTEHHGRGTISLRNFWTRRFRRL